MRFGPIFGFFSSFSWSSPFLPSDQYPVIGPRSALRAPVGEKKKFRHRPLPFPLLLESCGRRRGPPIPSHERRPPPFLAIYSCADGLVLAGRSNGRAAPASPSPRRPRPLRILHRASFIHAGGAAAAGFIASDRSSIVPSHLSVGKLGCFDRSIVVPMWPQ